MATVVTYSHQRAHKFNAKRTEVDGISFPSKLQADVYCSLLLLQRAGVVRYFLREVPLHLPGGVTNRVDFQVFYADGRVRYLDAKGMETAMYRTKKKIVEATYPVVIEPVKKIKGRLVGL